MHRNRFAIRSVERADFACRNKPTPQLFECGKPHLGKLKKCWVAYDSDVGGVAHAGKHFLSERGHSDYLEPLVAGGVHCACGAGGAMLTTTGAWFAGGAVAIGAAAGVAAAGVTAAGAG